MNLFRFQYRIGGCLLIALLSPAVVVAAPCTPQGEPELKLTVVAAEIAGSRDRVLSIAVHANDCVRLHLPDYYARRGDYVATLGTRERAALESLKIAQRAKPYSQDAMMAEAAAIETAAARGIAEPELFAVLDADYVELTTRSNGEAATTTRALAPLQYAERYPEIASLKALKEVAQALIAISRRDDLVAAGSATEGGR